MKIMWDDQKTSIRKWVIKRLMRTSEELRAEQKQQEWETPFYSTDEDVIKEAVRKDWKEFNKLLANESDRKRFMKIIGIKPSDLKIKRSAQ